MDLTMDKSIVVRFRPGALAMEFEYLLAYDALPNDPAAWGGNRAEAHEFFTHGDAENWAKANPFTGLDGKEHRGWPEVLSSVEAVPRRDDLPRVTTPPRASNERRAGRVSPVETAEMLDKRGLF